jgi:hypothetical protein
MITVGSNGLPRGKGKVATARGSSRGARYIVVMQLATVLTPEDT